MSHIASSYNRSVFFYIPRCLICGDIQNTLYSFILGFSRICSTERTQTVDILSKFISYREYLIISCGLTDYQQLRLSAAISSSLARRAHLSSSLILCACSNRHLSDYQHVRRPIIGEYSQIPVPSLYLA